MTAGSCFAGAGGFDMGFHAAGLDILWQIEIDKTCRSVLARHHPDCKRFADIRDCGQGRKHRLKKVDVVMGGFPCQDVSLAGKREGFGGQRSSLFHELVRIAAELRPRFLVWENVPGLLSSWRPTDPPPSAVEGREWEVEEDSDFETVLRELGRIGYFGTWRLLDAVHAGVPQSRPRLFGVFAPGLAGAKRACQILAFPESLRWHPAPGGEAQADIAGCLGGGTPGRGWSDDLDRAGAFIPTVASGLTGHDGGPNEQDSGLLVAFIPEKAYCLQAEAGRNQSGNRIGNAHNTTLIAFGGNDTRGERDTAATLTGKAGTRMDFATETFVVGCLSANGKAAGSATQQDAENGLLVYQCHGNNVGPMGVLRGGSDDVQSGVPFVFDSKQSGEGSSEMAPTLRAMGHDGSHANGGGQLAVSSAATGVRRLTPVEQERLMGWP